MLTNLTTKLGHNYFVYMIEIRASQCHPFITCKFTYLVYTIVVLPKYIICIYCMDRRCNLYCHTLTNSYIIIGN